MPTLPKCCVNFCYSTRADYVLHKFPNPEKDPGRFKNWVDNIGGQILSWSSEKIYKRGLVCNKHFEGKYTTPMSKLLTLTAVPTLHLKALSSSMKPLQDVTNTSFETPVDQIPPEIVDNPFCQPSTSKALSSSKKPLQDVTNTSFETPVDQIPPEIVDNPFCQPSTSKAFASSSYGQERQQNKMSEVSSSVARNTLKDMKNNKENVSCLTNEFKSKKQNWSCKEYLLIRKELKTVKKKNEKFAERLERASNLSTNKNFLSAMKKFKSPAELFTKLQFREIVKPKMGRRFKKDEKIMSMMLYKQGPRAYRWLSKIFILPSPVTLSRMLSKANLKAGINKNIFEELKKRVNNMKTQEKFCILLFDEMSISPGFLYNKRKDLISGFVNYGDGNIKKIADHALVFMIRGVQKNFKQVISYSFCAGSTPKHELAKQIKCNIKMLYEIGLKVVATVCDQGTTNVSAINYLNELTKEKYLRKNETLRDYVFEIDDHEIVPLFDPPHLIKGIRNNLLTKNLICCINGEQKIAKWEHLQLLHQEDPSYQGVKLIKNLTENHVNPEKIKKMKVKIATQVFSSTVACNMGYLAGQGILPIECQQTADVLLFFDRLFDSFNGSYYMAKQKTTKSLLGPLTNNSIHKKTWLDSKEVLKTMKYISQKGNSTVPSIKNWILNIENILHLQKILNNNQICSIWMRHFNQDPVENFFGCVRSHGARNINPTAANFETAFASLLINNQSNIHSTGSNCEEDECSNLQSLKILFFETRDDVAMPVEIDIEDVTYDYIIGVENKKTNIKVKAQLEFVTGYVLRKTKRKVFKNCPNCRNCLYDHEKKSTYLNSREHIKNKNLLSYPSEKLISCFSDIQDIVTQIIYTKSEKKYIKNYIKTLLAVFVDYSFIECSDHKSKIIIFMEDLCCNFFLCNYCKDLNKMLKGQKTIYANNDLVQKLAIDYYNKHKK